MPEKNSTPISQAIRQVVKEFAMHPYDINDGHCDEFTDRVCGLVPDAEGVDLGIEYGHVVILYKKKWYDAEEPEGVKHWTYLPLITRQLRTERKLKYSRIPSPWRKI